MVLRQMQQDGPGLKQFQRLSVHSLLGRVHQSRQLSERIDRQVVGLSVLASPQIQLLELVGNPLFLEVPTRHRGTRFWTSIQE